MNLLEPADGGSIEELTDGKELLVDRVGGDVEVLLHSGEVGETDVKEFDVLFFDELQYFRRVGEHAGHSCFSWD